MPKKLLFSVVCPTCEIVIGVHDPKRIGELIQCPKCSSFVQLDPPPGFVLPSDDTESETPPTTRQPQSAQNVPSDRVPAPVQEKAAAKPFSNSLPAPPSTPGKQSGTSKTSFSPTPPPPPPSAPLPEKVRLSEPPLPPSPGFSAPLPERTQLPEPMSLDDRLPEPMSLDDSGSRETFFAFLKGASYGRNESLLQWASHFWPYLIIGLASFLLIILGAFAFFSPKGTSERRAPETVVQNTKTGKTPDVKPLAVSSDPNPKTNEAPPLSDSEKEAPISTNQADDTVPDSLDAPLGAVLADEPEESVQPTTTDLPESTTDPVSESPDSPSAAGPATDSTADLPPRSEELDPAAAISDPAAESGTAADESASNEPTSADSSNANPTNDESEDELIADVFKAPDPFAPVAPGEAALVETGPESSAPDPVSTGPRLPQNVQDTLNVKLARIEIKEKPFSQMLQFLGNIGLPLEVNWESLRKRRINQNDPISYIGESVTVEILFREILAQRQLECQWNDDLQKFQLVSSGTAAMPPAGTGYSGKNDPASANGPAGVSADGGDNDNGAPASPATAASPGFNNDEKPPLPRRERTECYQIGDITAGSAASMEALIKVVKAYIAPNTWSDAGGAGRINSQPTALSVTQTDRVHEELADFLDRLRMARKQPPLIHPEATVESLNLLQNRASGILNKKVNLSADAPTGLNSILALLSRTAGVPIVLDESSLKREGKSPSFPLKPQLEDVTLAKALTKILEEPGLTYFADSPYSLIVTTQSGRQMFSNVEFYPVGDLVQKGGKPALLIQILKKIVPESWQEAGGRGRIDFDDKSDCLVALQSPDVHEQIQLFLGKLRERWKAKPAGNPQ